jgi:hypothetical protein
MKALERFAPHPGGFRRIWAILSEEKSKRTPFYAWEPMPPGPDYVALGMLFTTSPEVPDVESVRCVHRTWCQEVQQMPKRLWDDRGLSGRAGSLWTVNNLQLVWATTGWNQPPGPFFELREWPFSVADILTSMQVPLQPAEVVEPQLLRAGEVAEEAVEPEANTSPKKNTKKKKNVFSPLMVEGAATLAAAEGERDQVSNREEPTPMALSLASAETVLQASGGELEEGPSSDRQSLGGASVLETAGELLGEGRGGVPASYS